MCGWLRMCSKVTTLYVYEFVIIMLLYAVSLQDASDHDSPQLPILYHNKQYLSAYYTSLSLFCHPDR